MAKASLVLRDLKAALDRGEISLPDYQVEMIKFIELSKQDRLRVVFNGRSIGKEQLIQQAVAALVSLRADVLDSGLFVVRDTDEPSNRWRDQVRETRREYKDLVQNRFEPIIPDYNTGKLGSIDLIGPNRVKLSDIEEAEWGWGWGLLSDYEEGGSGGSPPSSSDNAFVEKKADAIADNLMTQTRWDAKIDADIKNGILLPTDQWKSELRRSGFDINKVTPMSTVNSPQEKILAEYGGLVLCECDDLDCAALLNITPDEYRHASGSDGVNRVTHPQCSYGVLSARLLERSDRWMVWRK